MKKLITFNSLLAMGFIFAAPVFAQSADVAKVQSFLTSIILIMVAIAGTLAVIFFIWGGYGYITSTGNPENLEKSKKTIQYSAIGLVISLGAYVLTNIVTQVAQAAFGH